MGIKDKELIHAIDDTMSNKQLNVRLQIFVCQPISYDTTSNFSKVLGDYPFVFLTLAKLPNISMIRDSYVKLFNVCNNEE